MKSGKNGKEHPTLTVNPESKVGKATWNFGMDQREDRQIWKKDLCSAFISGVFTPVDMSKVLVSLSGTGYA